MQWRFGVGCFRLCLDFDCTNFGLNFCFDLDVNVSISLGFYGISWALLLARLLLVWHRWRLLVS